jgi:hypothetical protein
VNCPHCHVEGDHNNSWKPGGWWRVVEPDGGIWCETSDEQEARDSMRPGDTLERLYGQAASQWMTEK